MAGPIRISVLANASQARREFQSVSGQADTLGSKFGKVGKAAGKLAKVGAVAGVAAIGGAFASGLKSATEYQKITAQTEAVLKSTGGAANVAAADVARLGSKISGYSGLTNEAVEEGQNLLLTFTKVRNETGKGNDIFNQATKSVADMSVALGTDMKSSALQVGKALNDPTKGVTALSRAGVSFTQSQKDQIKALQESGDMLGAQKVILGELKTQFGGAAKAAGDTFGGAMNKVKNAFSDTLRDAIMPMLPRLTELAETLAAKIPGAINGTIGAFKAVSAVVTPVIAIVRRLFIAFEGSGQAGAKMQELRGTVQQVWNSIKSIFQSAIEIVRVLWQSFGSTIVRYAKASFSNVIQIVRGAFKVIQGIFNVVAGILKGDWSRVWTGIKQIASGALNVVKGIVKQGLNVVRTIFSAAGTALRGIWSRIWDGLKSLASSAWSGIKSAVSTGIAGMLALVRAIPGKVSSALGNLGSLLYNAGASIVQGLVNGIQSKISAVTSTLSNLTSKIPDWKGPRDRDKRLLRPAGRLIMGGLVRGIEDGSKGVEKSLHRVTELVQKTLEKRLERSTAKLKEIRDTAKQYAASIAESYSSLDNGFGNGIAGLRLQMQANRNDARAMLAALEQAKSRGLDGGLFSALATSGDLNTAQQMAALSRREIRQFERLHTQQQRASTRVGRFAADTMYAQDIRQESRHVRQLEQAVVELRREVKQLSKLDRAVEKGAQAGTQRGMTNRNTRTAQRSKAGR